jgi:hypothetical protein
MNPPSARDLKTRKPMSKPNQSSCAPNDDPVDEASEESFPASDPPNFTGAAATPSKAPASPCRSPSDDQHSP